MSQSYVYTSSQSPQSSQSSQSLYQNVLPSFNSYQQQMQSPITDMCHRGPTYWCQSDANFAQCVRDKTDFTGSRREFASCQPHVEYGSCSSCGNGPSGSGASDASEEYPVNPPEAESSGPLQWCKSEESFMKYVTARTYQRHLWSVVNSACSA